MRYGCSRLEVIEAVWMWSVGVVRCSVDVVDVRY